MARRIYTLLAKHFHGLEGKLRQAAMYETKKEFLRKVVTLAVMGSIGLVFFLFLVFDKTKLGENRSHFFIFLLVAFGTILFFLFNYFLRLPDVVIMKKRRAISKEIVFAGRYLIIELESGVPLYNALKDVANNYPGTGKYLKDVIHKVDLGSSMEEAIVETIQNSPSNDLNRILWQVLNSLKTGSDVKWSLNSVLDQIVREQNILVKEYGRKLNPLAMFYMMIAVIIPSLGTTMMTVLATFLNVKLSLTFLIILVFGFAFMQFMFVAIVKNARPPVEM